MNWITFYAVSMWTLGFWAWGADYTIVKNRHVGLDIGTNRRAVDVPALVGGRVIIVTKTRAMAWVVVLDTGLPGARRYHAYCHLSAVNLPRPGTWIERGDRVAKLAAGARDYDDPEFPGTAWGGIHLHLVMCDVAHGAYTLNTGARFANPEDLIRELLSGSPADAGGSTPFDPEEDDMSAEAEAKINEIYALLTAGKAGEKDEGEVHRMLRELPDRTATAVWSAEVGSGSSRRTVAQVLATVAANVSDIPARVWGATLGRGSKRRTVAELLSNASNRPGS